MILGLDTKDGVVLAFDQENELATKGTTERRSTSPSVNRTEPEKEEEAKLGHSIRDVRTIKNQE